jgi:hypothetical protein
MDRVALGKLPQACQPSRLLDEHDIAGYAYDLLRHHCEEAEDVAEMIRELSTFFSQAAIRLSEISAPGNVAGRVLKLFS